MLQNVFSATCSAMNMPSSAGSVTIMNSPWSQALSENVTDEPSNGDVTVCW